MMKNLKIKYSTFFIFTIGMLMFLNTFNTSSNVVEKSIGLISLLLFIIMGNIYLIVYLFKNGKIHKKILKTFFGAIILIFSYTMGVIIDGFGVESIKVLLQLILVINLFLGLSFYNWEIKKLKIIGILTSIFYFIYFMLWLYYGLPIPFKGNLGNPNALGGIVFFILYFLIVAYLTEKRKKAKYFWLFSIFMGMVLCFLTMARSVWLAGVIALFVYLIWDFFKNRFVFNMFFYLVIIAIIVGTYFYSNINEYYFLESLNSLVYTYTGKNLLSGRNRFWYILIEYIMQRPLVGYGAGTRPSDLIDISLSAHSLYIQVALQVGLVGIFSLFFFLKTIWEVMWFGKNNIIVKISGAFFVGIMIQQMFEVFLIQNNLAIGVLQWFIFAIGFSISHQVIRNKKNDFKQGSG